MAVAVGIVSKQDLPSEEWSLAPPSYWHNMAGELFSDVRRLYEQLDASFPLCPQGFPPIIVSNPNAIVNVLWLTDHGCIPQVFCIYICGSLASYLCKWPQRTCFRERGRVQLLADVPYAAVSPELAPQARRIFHRALDMLNNAKDLWPKARAWQNALAQTSAVFAKPDVAATGPSRMVRAFLVRRRDRSAADKVVAPSVRVRAGRGLRLRSEYAVRARYCCDKW